MNLQKYYITEDLFPKIFTDYVEKDYGILFFNENNKDSYDSNHAVIYKEKISDFQTVLEDIKKFYKAKGINPIIYQATADSGFFNEIKKELRNAGYKSWGEEHRYMLPLEENAIRENEEVIVKCVDTWIDDIETVFIEAEEPWEIEVVKKTLEYDMARCFIAYYEGNPAGVLYCHIQDGVIRGDYLLVTPKYRCKGIGRNIFSKYVVWCNEQDAEAYLWPDGETAERIYYEAGYRYVGTVIAGRAVYDEKEKNEIPELKRNTIV